LSEALVLRLEESDGFAASKATVSLLEGAFYWHPSFADRIQGAINTNVQVSGSFGVPARLKNLIHAHATDGVEL
jgi:hypothetical protein